MKWRVEHVIDAEVAEVERAVLAAENVALLPEYMPAIAEARVLEREERDGVVTRRTHFRPSATPPAFARGVSKEMLEWDEHLRWDLAKHAGEFRIEPNIPAEWRKYFESAGVYRLEPRGPGKTARVIESEVAIKVMIVGPIAERYAIGQLKGQFEGEAKLLARVVALHRGG